MKQIYYINDEAQKKIKKRILKYYSISLIAYIIVFCVKFKESNFDISNNLFPIRIVMLLFLAFIGLIFCFYKIETYTKIKLIVLPDKIIYDSYTKNSSYEVKISDITNIVPIIKNKEILSLKIETKLRKYKIKNIEKLEEILNLLNSSDIKFQYSEKLAKIDKIKEIVDKIFIVFTFCLIIYLLLFNPSVDSNNTLLVLKSFSYYLSSSYLLFVCSIAVIKRKILKLPYKLLIVINCVILIIFVYQSLSILPYLITIIFN